MKTLPHLLLCFSLIVGCAAVEAEDRPVLQDELDEIADSLKLPRAFNLIHRLVGPSVVSIHTSERVMVARFGRGYEEDEVQVGEGSGFVFHSDGDASWIVTNAHVVIRTDRRRKFIRDQHTGKPLWYDTVQVATMDGRMHQAEPVGADPQTDLAVLKVPVPELEPVRWANSDRARVGSYVLALGYPLGVGYSATSGIISATAKSTGIYGERGYESFLQTDAAINPGNSGGPLVDMHGRVLGVNANIVSRSGGNVGIGFAIPANLARRVAEDLRDDGRVSRPMVGIQMTGLGQQQADRLGLDLPQAVRVSLVIPGSPAEQAGLAEDDVILAIDGREIADIQQFRSRIAAARIGEALGFRVWRDGKAVELDVTPVAEEVLKARIQELALAGARGPGRVTLPSYGLVLGNDQHRGVVVRDVIDGTPAQRAGIAAGDRILRVHKRPAVEDLEDFASLDDADQLVLEVFHRGRPFIVRLRK